MAGRSLLRSRPISGGVGGAGRSACMVAALVAASVLGACTGTDSEGRSVRPTQTPVTTPTMPTPTGPVAGAREALEMLARPEVRPNTGYVSENGDLLVWWEVRGLRARDAYRCRSPVVLTWMPHPAWHDGVRPSAVHAWLLAEGMREVYPTRSGFYLSHADCAGRESRDHARGLALDHRGRLRVARTSRAVEAPRPGAIRTSCVPPLRGGCQFDPATGTLLPLRRPFSWDGTWHDQTSVLWRSSSHISGTWSVDGGGTWNQFIDPWDAVPLRRGAATFAVSNGMMSGGRQSGYGELTGGSFREGLVEWLPEDAAPLMPLPRSVDGYRSWFATSGGALVGLGRRGAVYVSEGSNWHDITRHETGPCRPGVEVVGDYLVCGPQGLPYPRRGTPAVDSIRVSEDLGATWSTIRLDAVVPRTLGEVVVRNR